MNRQELINQIKQGKSLHYDIDNVELLRDVLQEAYPKDKGDDMQGQYKYYFTSNWSNDEWSCDNETKCDTIHLSSFIDTPKMISVEAVKDKLNEMLHDYQDEGNSDNSNINNRVIGAIRACNKLLTFLNTHTNVIK